MSRFQILVLLGSFALTYLAHSTALFGLVWLCERAGRLRALALREALWRAVLFGALLTAAWPFFAPDSIARAPWLGRITMPLARTAEPDSISRDSLAFPAPPLVPLEASESVSGSLLPVETVARAAASETSPRSPSGPIAFRTYAFAIVAALLALVLLAPAVQLRLWLGRRALVRDGELFDELQALRLRAGLRRSIRLSISPRINGPIAFGLLRPEICLPVRALRSLEPELARAMLAHELMHLARLDPLWLALGELARRLLFFQPLARSAHRRLIHLAELACDRGAVRLTGDRLALARSLAEVATWIQGRRPKALCAMARTRSRLEERVHSLLDAREEHERGSWRLLAPAFVAGAALALPTLAFERERVAESMPLFSLQHDHDQLEESLGILRVSLAELSNHALTQEEEARALELSSRARELSQLLSKLDVQITEHARRAPVVPKGP